jgi:hypothetical protein
MAKERFFPEQIIMEERLVGQIVSLATQDRRLSRVI